MGGKRKNKWARAWASQTDLGRQFGLSAVKLGRELDKLGLREDRQPSGRQPTRAALEAGFAVSAPLADGTPNFRWNRYKVLTALTEAGLVRQAPEQVREAALDAEAKAVLREIRRLQDSPDGMDQKMADVMWQTLDGDLAARVDAMARAGRT